MEWSHVKFQKWNRNNNHIKFKNLNRINFQNWNRYNFQK